ncbi:hypothetical protein BIV57_17780 [Mangrovactinospora gilvigrisea]|uniref:Uncharacterized protein n=1 Tax=Mangrovactinospora gilvigrisea TaxID=1428644 RepID=A0A1J7BBX8_9ACTN|nr:hypothetical protein [Mangrovactinospora gilvigrisea]OIV36163.1 hypothetical protein BIV57_17780 [Mangrovactinospora gilvigrisea]
MTKGIRTIFAALANKLRELRDRPNNDAALRAWARTEYPELRNLGDGDLDAHLRTMRRDI